MVAMVVTVLMAVMEIMAAGAGNLCVGLGLETNKAVGHIGAVKAAMVVKVAMVAMAQMVNLYLSDYTLARVGHILII